MSWTHTLEASSFYGRLGEGLPDVNRQRILLAFGWFNKGQLHPPARALLYLRTSFRKLNLVRCFRLACHTLPFVMGRCNRTPPRQQSCQQCHTALGDEKAHGV